MLLKFSKASNGIVSGAHLIDVALTIGFFVFIFSFLPEHLLVSIKGIIDTNLLVLLGFVFYRLLFILFFDFTPGMKVFYIQFLGAEQQPLRIKEKLLASIFVLFRGVDYYKRELIEN